MFTLEDYRELTNKNAFNMLAKDYFLYGPDLNKFLKSAMVGSLDNIINKPETSNWNWST